MRCDLMLSAMLIAGASCAPAQTTGPQTMSVVVVMMPQDLDKSFQTAHQDFMKRDLDAAARDIRKAADDVGRGVEKGGREADAVAQSVGRDLRGLADDVEKGAVRSDDDLKRAFARAHYELGRYHQKQAQSQGAQNSRSAGEHLQAAVGHLESGFRDVGRGAETVAVGTVNAGRFAAGKLMEGGGWVTAEAGKATSDVGRELEKLGRYVVPGRAPVQAGGGGTTGTAGGLR